MGNDSKLDSVADARLPCDVLVQPATWIKQGCRVQTLLECIEFRRERSEKGPPLDDILSKSQAREIAALRSRVGELEAALKQYASGYTDTGAHARAVLPLTAEEGQS